MSKVLDDIVAKHLKALDSIPERRSKLRPKIYGQCYICGCNVFKPKNKTCDEHIRVMRVEVRRRRDEMRSNE